MITVGTVVQADPTHFPYPTFRAPRLMSKRGVVLRTGEPRHPGSVAVLWEHCRRPQWWALKFLKKVEG